MNNKVIESYRPLYNSILEKPLIILGLFQAQFGEENVELQGIKSLEEFVEYCQSIYSSLERATESLNSSENRNNAIKKSWDGMPDSNICVIVHFPQVRITNENNRFIDITHLWARVTLTLEGTTCGRFQLCRTEYPESHWISDYAHSHLPGLCVTFHEPCTGSGPINGTITTCSASFQEDFWRLYCYELSLFVKVESLAGVPYRHLERVSPEVGAQSMIEMVAEDRHPILSARLNDSLEARKPLFKDFIRYLINKKILRFNFADGAIGLGMSPKEERVFFSNEFIEWYNLPDNPWKSIISVSSLLRENILKYVKFDNGRIMIRVERRASSNSSRRERAAMMDREEGRRLFTFKGQPVLLHFTERAATHEDSSSPQDIVANNYSILLDKEITSHFTTIILRLLNGKYGSTNTALRRAISAGGTAYTVTARDTIFL